MGTIRSMHFPECDRALIRASLGFMEATIDVQLHAKTTKKKCQLFHARLKLGVEIQQPAQQEDLVWAVQAGLSGA